MAGSTASWSGSAGATVKTRSAIITTSPPASLVAGRSAPTCGASWSTEVTVPVDRARAERAVRELLLAMGRDVDGDPDLLGTPSRVVEAYATELLSGYDVNVAALLAE